MEMVLWVAHMKILKSLLQATWIPMIECSSNITWKHGHSDTAFIAKAIVDFGPLLLEGLETSH